MDSCSTITQLFWSRPSGSGLRLGGSGLRIGGSGLGVEGELVVVETVVVG